MFESKNFDAEFNRRHIPFNVNPAILERYGLFTMIVLGESLADIIERMAEAHTHLADYNHFVLALLCVIGTWMIYFTLMDERTIEAKRYWPVSLFRGIHRFLIACLTLQSFFISQTLTTGKPVYYYGLLIVCALILLTLLALTRPALFNVHPLPKAKVVTFVIGIGLIGLMSVVPTYLGLFVIDFVFVGLGVYTWIDKD